MRLLPPPPRVLPDAVGAGVEATTGGSFLHPVGGAASLVLVGVSSFASGPGTMTVTLGGAAMTQVASSQYYSNGVNSSGQVAVYSMFNPPKNNQTVAVSFTGSYSYAVTANSVSYAGVVSLGTPAQASGSTSPAAQSASGGDPRGGFFQMLGGYANFTGYNQNERWAKRTKDEMFDLIRQQAPRFDTTFLYKPNAYPTVRAKGEMYLYKMAWYLHFKEIATQVCTPADDLCVIVGTIATSARRALARAALLDVCLQVHRVINLCYWDASTSWGLQVADYGLWAVQRHLAGKTCSWFTPCVQPTLQSVFTPWGQRV